MEDSNPAPKIDEKKNVVIPHAYHQNLPSNCIDPTDGVPYITKYANKKARNVVKLLFSIELMESLYCSDDDEKEEEEEEKTEEAEGDDDGYNDYQKPTMISIVKKCGRVHSQLSSLVSLKHSGISELDLCHMVLHILHLLTATVTITENEVNDGEMKGDEIKGQRKKERNVSLQFDDVGYILSSGKEKEEKEKEEESSLKQLEGDLSKSFALPSPARESLLSIVIMVLSKKGPLRPVSNTSIYPQDDEEGEDVKERHMLILNWRSLLRMLLRTAPYLDEHKVGSTPSDSTYRHNSVLRRTVNLIRHSRRFFDQGLRPPTSNSTEESPIDDRTARAIWDTVKSDLLYHTHSNSCFRAVILLYLFQPSRCTSSFYEEVMPYWMESWCSVDRCPEFDFLWLVMFCRARKYVRSGGYDWGPLRQRLLTQCGYWLQIPVGGVSADKSFPRASPPRTRGFPARLKSFVGSGSSYQEGIDFVAKVSKLVVFTVGQDDSSSMESSESESMVVEGGETSMSSGAKDILRFLSFVAPYFNPSNSGPWTFPLGALLHYLSYELCHRAGAAAGVKTLKESHPKLAAKLHNAEPYLACMEIPSHEVVAILDALLPLCQQALYSKNSHVARAGESALLYLTQIDPAHVAPPFLDFATRALDISSVNLSHQAPAALSALTRLVQPSLRRRPSVFLERLPEILRLSLAGIDSNDQNKTIRTLILYRNIASWIPIGDGPKRTSVTGSKLNNDGTVHFGDNIIEKIWGLSSTPEYQKLLQKLPESSLLYQTGLLPPNDEEEQLRLNMLVEEMALSMSDWSLAFLDRIYSVLRAAGEQEKVGKSAAGVASRHSSADVQQSRNFSRVMKECLTQVFSSMDDKTHEIALRSVVQFLKDETLPLAVKDASALCQAIASSRLQNSMDVSPGLDILVPILTEDLEHHSCKTVIYRLRCLAGAVKHAGKSVLKHKDGITSAIKYALSVHKDKHVFKTGCKLLRHTISSQCGIYPVDTDTGPRFKDPDNSDRFAFGRSAQLHNDCTEWHVPSGKQIDFAVELIEMFAMEGLRELGGIADESFVDIANVNASDNSESQADSTTKGKTSIDIPQWRRSLRVMRYTLRGCVGFLLDVKDEENSKGRDSRPSSKDKAITYSLKRLSFSSFILNGDDENEDDDWDPNEKAVENVIQYASKETQSVLQHLRVKLCTIVTSMMSLIASEIDEAPLNIDSDLSEVDKLDQSKVEETKEPTKKDTFDRQTPQYSIGSDAKICKEITEISLILLTRRGVSFRCQDLKTIWGAQKQILTDYVLASQSNYLASTLQRAGVYGNNENVFYKDGENGGKTLPRRLLVTRVDLFHQSVQRHCSFEIPRLLRRRRARGRKQYKQEKMFTLKTTINEFDKVLQECIGASSLDLQTRSCSSSLDAYEGIIDGLFSFSFHTNVQVRSSALGVVDYALTRFGWVVRERVPRLLSAISLQDENDKGDFGIPSCAQLSKVVDAQGKRKRLSEVLKGVCSILAVPRIIKELISTEKNRFSLTQTLCNTQRLLSLLPDEDMQKMVHYFHGIFSQFRSKFYSFPRVTSKEQGVHESCVHFLSNKLLGDDLEKEVVGEKMGQPIAATDNREGNNMEYTKGDSSSEKRKENGNSDKNLLHWRNRLITGWFITNFVDENDLLLDDPLIASRVWTTCFQLIENETGQPLQRVALGLFGRLVALSLAQEGSFFLSHNLKKSYVNEPDSKGIQKGDEATDPAFQMNPTGKVDVSLLRDQVVDASFCRALVTALVFDHKEDSSVGGGHHPQWSAGIEEILRDATSNLAPRSLFPFQRISRSSNVFRVQHSQLIQAMLLTIGKNNAQTSTHHLLSLAKEIASAPPSEDQRNQQCTSAEIFGGVCRAMLQYSSNFSELVEVWNNTLLPFLDEVIPKIPISLSGAFFDAFRYGIHHFPPSHFYSLTNWLIEKIEKTIWQHERQRGDDADDMELQKDSSGGDGSSASSTGSNDGFATQSKWLFAVSAVLIELDAEADLGAAAHLPWYTYALQSVQGGEKNGEEPGVFGSAEELNQSWNLVSNRLLPCLLNALGHPYEKCREHIAGCLFRICYCHRKFMNKSKALPNAQVDVSSFGKDCESSDQDPGFIIIDKLCSIGSNEEYSFEERHHALITARKFIVYCVHLGDSKHEYSEYIIPLMPLSFESVKVTMDDSSEEGASAANRVLEAEVVKGYRYTLAEVSSSCVISYGLNTDMTRVLETVDKMSSNNNWQVRQAAIHFLRCFQGCHKFLFSLEQTKCVTNIVAKLLSDERREVSSAAMAALTGILAATSLPSVSELVQKYVKIANKSRIKRKKKKKDASKLTGSSSLKIPEKEKERARQQQTSVFFLCASVLARPYDTPSYVPEALTAISKHSFEKSAPLAVRETVKMCCGEFKRTHMSDNWEVHRKQFTQEQLEALEDVVSTPHYYA